MDSIEVRPYSEMNSVVPRTSATTRAGPPETPSARVEITPRRRTHDDWTDFWPRFIGQKEKRKERPSIYWCTKKGPVKKRSVVDLRRYPFFDTSSWTLIPKANKNDMPTKKCHLLMLPKELRLEIWTYVLTDPSIPRATLEIDRAPKSPSKTSLRFPHPCIRTAIQPTRNTPISIDILATNDFIYREALPILYRSIRFAVLDLQGIFMPFLSTLSSFAHSHIRFMKLRIPTAAYETDPFSPGNQSTLLVNWAITCAQVAKIENLLEVEVEGYTSYFPSKRIRDGIMNPLLKIKAKKVFDADVEAEAQGALREAEKALGSQAELRRRRTLSEAAERAQEELRREIHLREEKEKIPYPIWVPESPPQTSEAEVEHGIKNVSGLRRFEEELQEHEGSNAVVEDEPPREVDLDLGEWEMVSLGSGAGVHKAAGREDGEKSDDEDAWTDAASTLVDRS